MFTSFYSVLRSEIGKNLLSSYNLFTYSNIYLFKCNTVKLLSFYSVSLLNLSTSFKTLSVRWGLFFYRTLLLFSAMFFLG